MRGAAHLVPDTLLLDMVIANHFSATHQANIASMEQQRPVRWLVCDETATSPPPGVDTASQPNAWQCCTATTPAAVQRACMTFSSVRRRRQTLTPCSSSVALPLGGETSGETIRATSAQSALQLWAKPTDSPGFVTLHWARTSQCDPDAPLKTLCLFIGV